MKLDHIAVYVKDLESARDFFVRYFGATANSLYHNPRTGLQTYFLSFGNGARLELIRARTRRTKGSIRCAKGMPTSPSAWAGKNRWTA